MSQTPQEIEAEIAMKREHLAETVDALAAKLDVPSQARARAAAAKDRMTTDGGRPRPDLLAAVAGLAALVVGLAWWRRRR
jgi:hypothetical protein